MGTLYLVRHGQASLGASDYDQLSERGQQQSLRLGQYFAARGLRFKAVLRGSLKRHAQTWAGIEAGLATTHSAALPLAPLVWPGLNEYSSEALIQALQPGTHTRPTTPETTRAHFRLLRQALKQWAGGSLNPAGMPAYAEFAAGVAGALEHVRSHCDGDVLLVSSGGPISCAVAQTLGASPDAFVELNLRLRNTAVTEFAFTPKYHALLSFNTLPHLDTPPYGDWQTYA